MRKYYFDGALSNYSSAAQQDKSGKATRDVHMHVSLREDAQKGAEICADALEEHVGSRLLVF